MIRTKLNIESVPSNWIFEHYCNLNEKLYGQDVKILSLFNNKDSVPSMVIYLKENKYLFKDFSSGKGGDGLRLVMALNPSLSKIQTIRKIVNAYENGNIGEQKEIKAVEKFKLSSHEKRNWNVYDAKYWLKYNIDSDILSDYNVIPLKSYTLSKNENNKIFDIKKEKGYIYGYFKKDGTLYKVYEPNCKNKFFTAASYIQGTEQLEYKSKNLVICSSLKDMMSLTSFKLDLETVAPTSENTMISKSHLSSYFLKYDNIFTLFDNDQAGQRAAMKYSDLYGIETIYINLSKDLSDSISDYGIKTVKNYIKPLIP